LSAPDRNPLLNRREKIEHLIARAVARRQRPRSEILSTSNAAIRKIAYYLAAAVYGFAFLFPDDPAQRPDGFDPRFRTASDLYHRSLTSGFASADRSRVLLQSGRFELPFATIDITYDAATAHWATSLLVEFTPADELHIKELQNRYLQSTSKLRPLPRVRSQSSNAMLGSGPTTP
jgi:hypothetical protein